MAIDDIEKLKPVEEFTKEDFLTGLEPYQYCCAFIDDPFEFERAKAKYGDMDENGLLRELSRRVAEQKKNGTFDAAQTAAYVAALSPYLNERQKKALCEIIDS